MLSFPRWLMQQSWRSVALAFITMLVPLLFWISCAICALNVMRKGWLISVPILLAALLPAVFWLHLGQVLPLVCWFLSLIMALLLRNNIGWPLAIIATAFIAMLLSQFNLLVTPSMLPPQWIEVLQQQPNLMAQLTILQQQLGLSLPSLWLLIFNFFSGILIAIFAIISVVIARSWQARLYNPGGFRQEFHNLHYPRKITVALIIITLIGAWAGYWSTLILLLVPFLIAGIALIHGIIGLTRQNVAWLVILYVGILLLQQIALIIILLALFDSFIDFRRLLAKRLSH